MRLIGWLLTCLLSASAILARVYSKEEHPVERKDVLAMPGRFAELRSNKALDSAAAAPPLLSTQHSKLLEHGNGSRNFSWNTDLFRRDEKDGKQGMLGLGQPRTFGHKRIQFMLMPLMYKMGVMMTLLTVLTVISLKGLLIGAILLILKLGTIVGKFTSGWSSYTHHPSAASVPSHGWPSQSNQPIHLHLHNSLPHGHLNHPYHAHGWISASASDSLDSLDRSHMEHYYYKG